MSGKGSLREGIQPEANFLPDLHASDVPLVYRELQLEGVGAPHEDDRVARVDAGAELLFGSRGEDDAAHWGSDRCGPELLLEHRRLASQRFRTEALKPLLPGVA